MSTGNSHIKTFPFGQDIVWQPRDEWIKHSNLQRFINKWHLNSYTELMSKSVSDIEWFWEAVLQDLDIQFYEEYTKIVDFKEGIPFPDWCVNGKMNIVHNCLDKWQNSAFKKNIAFIWESEDGQILRLSYEELFYEVNRCANAFRQIGLKKGDVVGLFLPMIPELLFAFLATIKIGAIILPLFSGYGPNAIATRLVDASAKVLITADGFSRRGKTVGMKSTADEAIQNVRSLEFLIVVQNKKNNIVDWNPEKDLWWHDLIPSQSIESETAKTAAEDILMIIYTSGTTGKPKGALHTHCGFPIKAAQDLYHCMDLKPRERLYWMTDMGWMMGPWEVFGSLLIGATMIFYDGAPDYPNNNRLWELIEKHKISHLGVSPALVRILQLHGKGKKISHNLSSLRMVGSTGSPWDPESWLWLFKNVLNSEKPIFNYSGGTEISGGILCGNFFRPLKPAAFSDKVPGMDADVVDENGKSIRNKVGELVIRKPWIGMTRGFWKDKQRYLDTYWSKYPDVWFHGDYAAIDNDQLWYILGRSDDTIKVAGKRLGPAEFESIVNSFPAVVESAAIAVPHPVKDNEVVIFCVLKQNIEPTEDLRQELLDLVTSELGKPLKPKEIKFVTALPKTRNAKVMNRIIRAVYLGLATGDVGNLEDPASLEAIRNAN